MTKPFLKWPGGKRKLLPNVLATLGPIKGSYFEPFAGGGAVAMALGHRAMVLSDMCVPLVITYRTVQTAPLRLADAFDKLPPIHEYKDHYYDVRAAHNEATRQRLAEGKPVVVANQADPLYAARFIWLNRTCFNGLYRERQTPPYKFNVPVGAYKAPKLPEVDELLWASKTLAGAVVSRLPADQVVPLARRGDVVYCDPPYCETFSGYVAGGFADQDHETLAQVAREAAARGARVVISNSDSLTTRRIYHDAEVVERIPVRYSVAADGERRAETWELLLAYPAK